MRLMPDSGLSLDSFGISPARMKQPAAQYHTAADCGQQKYHKQRQQQFNHNTQAVTEVLQRQPWVSADRHGSDSY